MLEEKNTLISGASAKLLKAIMVIMNGSSMFRSSQQEFKVLNKSVFPTS